MTPREFLKAIQNHPSLHVGRGPRDDRVYVVYLGPDDVRVGWELDPATVREHPWATLEVVLTGRRRAFMMGHFARVVGYYSNMRNWNFSKLAEARDRARGNYVVPEPRMNDVPYFVDVPMERVECGA